MNATGRFYGLNVKASLALLVASLILCQVVFILIMWVFWRETKLELRRQLRAKEVIEQIESIRLSEKEVLLALADARVSKKALRFPAHLTSHFFADKAAEFRLLAPKMIGLNEQLIQHATELDKELDVIRPLTTQDLTPMSSEWRQSVNQMDELLEDMRSRFNDLKREHAEKLMLANTVDFIWMALAFVAVLTFAILATIFFARVIETRISSLVRNSELAAKGQPLLPPLTGADEFATVDSAFRKMTAALKEESENLRLSESKTRTIIESLPLGLLLVLPNGEIEAANNTAALLLGSSQAVDLKGHQFEEYFSGKLCSDDEGASSSQIVRRVNERAASTSFPADVLQKVYESPDGSRVLVIFSDISDRERMRKLREEFVAVVSHEIRTPLTSVRAFLKLLKNKMFGDLNDDGTAALRQMDAVLRRLIALVNELVDAGKIELGHFDLDTKEFPLGEIVESAADSVAALAEQCQIDIDLPDCDMQVICDRDRTIQVLVNLLSNAIKYSPPQSTVTVAVAADDTTVKVSVRDVGAGIPEDDLGQIFDRFRQVKSESHKRKDSSGLGLYIAKDIVENQGGTIGVLSEEGKGSVFWFTLPLAPPAASIDERS